MEERIWPVYDLKRTFVDELDNIILHLIKGGCHCAQEERPGTSLFPMPEPATSLAFQKVQRALKHNENRPRRTPPYASHKIFDFLLHLSASRWNAKKNIVTNLWGKRHSKSNSGAYPPVTLHVPRHYTPLEATPRTPDGHYTRFF